MTNNHNIIKIIKDKIISSREEFKSLIKNGKNAYIIYISPVNYLFLRKEIKILLEVSHIRIDTTILCFLINLFLKKNIQRLSMDLQLCVSDLFDFAISNRKSIFFIGGTKEEIEVFISKIKNFFPKLNIVGYINGFASDEEIINRIDEIKKRENIDFILVGLGNKRQELFIYKYKDIFCDSFLISCGAFISQTARSKGIKFYPNFIYNYNLRFLYRILKEPRIFFRILIIYPVFFAFFLYDIVNYKLKNTAQK